MNLTHSTIDAEMLPRFELFLNVFVRAPRPQPKRRTQRKRAER